MAAISHIALRVADLEAAAAALAERGIAFTCDDIPEGELRQLYLTDPNGARIELNITGRRG